MKSLKLVVAIGVLMLPFAYVATPVSAATAHNSQAGAMGGTSNSDSPSMGKRRMKSMKRSRMHTMKKAM